MTTAQLISAALEIRLNVGSRDGGYAVKRKRAHFEAQAVVKEMMLAYPWWWRNDSSTVTTTTDSLADLPSNFESFGTRGGVYVPGGRQEIRYRNPDEILRQRQIIANTNSVPLYYTLKGITRLGVPQIVFAPALTATQDIDLENYVKKPPVLVDAPVNFQVATGAAGALTGVYYWALTWTFNVPSNSPSGTTGETEAGILTLPLTLTAQRASLYGLPVVSDLPQNVQRWITGRKLYRTEAGGSVPENVDTLDATTAYTAAAPYSDNTLDAALGSTPPDPDHVVSGMEQIPDSYHETVVLTGLMAKLRDDQGDLRSMNGETEFQRACRQAWVNEKQGRQTTKRAPRYGSTSRRY